MSEDINNNIWAYPWPVGSVYFSTKNESPDKALGYGKWKPLGLTKIGPQAEFWLFERVA